MAKVFTKAETMDYVMKVRGTWRPINALESNGLPNKPTALFCCPGCGGTGSLAKHDIAEDGMVNPSVLCGCNYHEWIQLEGWTHEEQINGKS